MGRFWLAALVLADMAASTVHADGHLLDYRSAPYPKWGPINVTGGLEYGNAVEVFPDDSKVYATSSDGTLTIIDAATGESTTYDPNPSGEASTLTCESGISFHHGGSSSIAVYAVKGDIDGEKFSTVIAVKHPEGTELWTHQLQGEAMGTPVISSDGLHVYVTHNTGDVIDKGRSNSTSGSGRTGHFTMLSTADEDEGDRLVWNASEAFPFGPAGLVKPNQLGGNYKSDCHINGTGAFSPANLNDLVIFSKYHEQVEQSPSGPFRSGATRAFQKTYDTPNDPSTYFLACIGTSSWSVLHAPVFSAGGQSMYLGTSKSELRGWYNGNKTTGEINRYQFDANRFHLWVVPNADRPGNQQRIARQSPPYSGLTLSADENVLFYVSNKYNIYAADVETNAVEPIMEQSSALLFDELQVIKAAVLVSPDGDRLYYAGDDMVYAKTVTGGDLWAEPAAGKILSDFSLSSDGSTLYYGTTNGMVAAWNLLSTGAPTAAPIASATDTPSISAEPSSVQSYVPSFNGTRSSPPSEEPSFTGGRSASNFPSLAPSRVPSSVPSMGPMQPDADVVPSLTAPSTMPSSFTTNEPSVSVAPIESPSNAPSVSPSNSMVPSPFLSTSPSFVPTSAEKGPETNPPSGSPTNLYKPSAGPSMSLTTHPSNGPSTSPSTSALPSAEPSRDPTQSDQRPTTSGVSHLRVSSAGFKMLAIHVLWMLACSW